MAKFSGTERSGSDLSLNFFTSLNQDSAAKKELNGENRMEMSLLICKFANLRGEEI